MYVLSLPLVEPSLILELADLIYASSSRVNLSIFLVISTNILFLLGAGLLSKAVGAFERYKYIQE